MLFSLQELFDMVVMTAIIGYIFKDMFPEQRFVSPEAFQVYEYTRFKSAMLAVAPAIILHELGHKFVALALGIQATFHAAYGFLLFGLVLKLFHFPFIFFVPAYVSHIPTTVLAGFFIALAGPMVHAMLWLTAKILLSYGALPKKYMTLAFFTQYINGMLFILNMLPIPGFDGYHVFSALFQLLSQ